MLTIPEIDSKLISLGNATRAQVFYDMDFVVSHYDFMLLKFQKEIQLQDFLKRYSQ